MAETVRVLIADDNPDDRLFEIRQMREEMPDIEVIELTDAHGLDAAMESGDFDLVITDYALNWSDGFAILSAVKSRRPDCPVLMVTGTGSEAIAVEAMKMGLDDYIVKTAQRRTRLPAAAKAALRSAADRRAVREAREEVERLNERLSRRATELEVANRELEQLTRSISHDVRAPLVTIDGFAQALQRRSAGLLGSQGLHYVERIRANVRRLDEFTSELLDLSKAGTQPLSPEDFDLSAIVQDVADALIASDPDRRVEFSVAQGIRATGDRRLITRVLENLLGNAFKFTSRRKSAHIEFGVIDADGTDVYYVSDDGVGFDMGQSGRLFEPFGRLHDAEEFPGIGVGLASVRRIVGRHGGEVWAEGKAGAGATFGFTLGAPRPKEIPMPDFGCGGGSAVAAGNAKLSTRTRRAAS